MSPCLFALCMEYLSRRLDTLREASDFSYHPKCKRTNTTSLLFADDLLIFNKGDTKLVTLVKQQPIMFLRLQTYVQI